MTPQAEGRPPQAEGRPPQAEGRPPQAEGRPLDGRLDPLVDRMLGGDRRALARLITRVENREPAVPEIMRRVYPRTGRAYTVGVTGPPGAGKSTLVDRLTAAIRQSGRTVGVIAVDPTSPFTGGAVLGDRIRMQAHTLDPGVFIRSMATRGSLGGLARATAETQKLLDAAGFDWILVETVGVGQTELDVIKLADTTVVVLVPESGDGIQTMKAGLLEAADVLVVNKADREGAARLLTELKHMVHLHREGQQASRDLDWEVPILSTEAVHDVGVGELLQTIGRHRAALEASGTLTRRRQARRARELRDLILAELRRAVDRQLSDGGALEGVLADVEAGRVDPYTAIRTIAERLRLGPAAPA
ncbi:MAG TPA: methylmalonyl Co-A mutase-associated GTPase MeaB [Methylomirabilota bacterium]|nr:methylmalonyl Co-A mutase-associated GTPase MeaB [Methylomirabilota bacterium]